RESLAFPGRRSSPPLRDRANRHPPARRCVHRGQPPFHQTPRSQWQFCRHRPPSPPLPSRTSLAVYTLCAAIAKLPLVVETTDSESELSDNSVDCLRDGQQAGQADSEPEYRNLRGCYVGQPQGLGHLEDASRVAVG